MRILHLISQRPELTGSGVVLQALAKHASRNGHQNFLVAGIPGNTPPSLDFFPSDNCKYVRFETTDLPFSVVGMSDRMPYESSRFSEMSWSDLEKYKKAFEETISDAVHSFQPDLIHSHHLWIVSGIAKRLFPNLPVVATCHGSDLRQKEKCGDLFEEEIKHCRDLDHIFALTETQKQDILNSYLLKDKNISVIGSGYDQTLFYKKIKKEGSVCQILFAGKISRSKGVLWLLRSLIRIKHLPFELHLAGGGAGAEYIACVKLAEQLNGKVKFYGALSQQKLAQLMQQSHLLVLPSYFEGLPLVLLEALSTGCRIITTALPGIKEVFGGVLCDFIEMIDLPDLETIDTSFEQDEEGLEVILADKIERQLKRMEVSPNINLKSVEMILNRFTWEKIFEEVETVYRKILKNNL